VGEGGRVDGAVGKMMRELRGGGDGRGVGVGFMGGDTRE